MALDITVCASLAILRAAVVTLGTSRYKDYTMPLPPPNPGGANPRGERLVKSNWNLLVESIIVEDGGRCLQLV